MFAFRPLLFCSCVIAASAVVPATVDEGGSVENWISKTETINSAAARKAVGDFRRDVNDLDAVYVKGFEKSRSSLNEKLEKARVEASKNDKPDDAVKIRDAMDQLQRFNFSRLAKSKTPDVAINGDLRFVVGRWHGAWGTTGNKLLITITEDGKLIYEADQLRLAVQNNRLLALGAQHQNFEIIPSGTRLIVLGWTVSNERNPLTDQPDHVGILTRAN